MAATLSVGVVIPTHNRKVLLKQTLESLVGQSLLPDRIVVVADGCTDGTEEELGTSDAIIVESTPGVGAGGARNVGWRLLDTDLVAFIDDDCEAEPQWLARLAQAFQRTDVGLVQGKTVPAGDVGPYDRTLRILRETGLYESCNIAYRRTALEQAGGMNPGFGRTFGRRGGDPSSGGGSGFGEDTDLAWRVLRAGWRSEFADDAVVRHAVFPGTPASMLVEAWRNRLFPFLLREIPELRDCLPGGRWQFRSQSVRAQLALFGVGGGLLACARGRRPNAVALAVPYLTWLARQTRDPRAAARLAARDAVTSAALLVGSIRHRNLVL